MPANTESLEHTLQKGVWTPVWRTALTDDLPTDGKDAEWQAELVSADGSGSTWNTKVKKATNKATVMMDNE